MDIKKVKHIIFVFIFSSFYLCLNAQNYDSIVVVSNSLKKDTASVTIILKNVHILKRDGVYSKAHEVLDNLSKWIYTIKHKQYLANYYTSRANVYDYEGIYDSAYVYYDKSINLNKKLKNEMQVAANYLNKGVCYNYAGDSKNSMIYLLKALKIAEKIKYDKVIRYAQLNLGTHYSSMGNLKKSYYYFMKIYKEDLRQNMQPDAALVFNLSSTHFKNKNFDSCEFYILKAVEYYKIEKDNGGLADAYGVLGALYRIKLDYKKSLEYYQIALKLYHNLEVVPGGEVYMNVAVLYAFMNKENLAYKYLDSAEKIILEKHNIDQLHNLFTNKYTVGKILKNYEYALDNFEKYVKLHDSLYSTEKAKELLDLKTEYEVNKKEEEVKLSEKIKREKQKLELEAESREKEQRNRIILFSVCLVLIIIAIFTYFLFRRFKITKKQNEIIQKQKKEVEHQKEIVDEKNKEIIDSINYAKRLQDAIIPSESHWFSALPESFVLYLPKDIVAGDFYWLDVKENENQILFAAADCTGHGVPGAMVSVVCSNALDRAVNEYNLRLPSEILDKTTDLVIERFIKNGNEVKDGMDISFCALNKNAMQLNWAGANNNLWIIRDGEILEWKANKQPVGIYFERTKFKNHTIDLQKGDAIYIFSDGYADQFGGDASKNLGGKKFKESNLRKLLLTIHHLNMDEQKHKLKNEFYAWKNSFDQIDDVCVIGVKI